ncbi:DUF4412 domain-containing protein [Mucilaginibacter sp. UR6-11]|uniref:DUF4412 domain-containing protein n=1 Tax=Mucilaginibacter sp. UR6-11 TaxID=1435644 RepID=UPI001E64B495|nr:DUF4412 domain-containing protein [Mucilaginibacter sp. UR6-11]MCC8426222.1 DUF4412 domain-containing protein [Mucilaginibacter sp. UR6-11]
MNTKLKIALGLAFTALAFSASAQKTYTQGVAVYTLKTAMGNGESKIYFTTDSSAAVTQQGPALVKILTNSKSTYVAILVDVPVASIKKAAVLTPDEIEQGLAAAPKFTFTPAAETKVINGFNCIKVDVKDSKSGSSYVAWVTKDVVAPANSLTKYFAEAGGFPVQFTTIQQGQPIDVTLKSINEEKVPAGTFGIPAGFDKITLDDLKAMSGK